MGVHSIAWWPTVLVLGVAVFADLRSRRIPNWLSLPFMAVGVATQVWLHGWQGLRQSMGGLWLGALIFGVLFWMGGMGMGDVKLCAAIGAWVGPEQLLLALVATGLAGGVMALAWAICSGFTDDLFKGSSELMFGWRQRAGLAHPELVLANPKAFLPGHNLGATVQALESRGLVEVLAEPNVLAENGKVGSFLAGGEYPYPVVQGGNGTTGPSITIMFKEYGVRLNFIPTITPRGTIHLQVAPEVSSLDFTNAVQIDGYQIPAISIRKVKSEIELSEGQSFAIGGLLDNRETQTLQKIPFISSVPILGKLFQSITRTKTNTELIVIVTPETVQPIPAGAPVPKLKYHEPFMESNSDIPMHTPNDGASTRASQHPPATIPVEKLIESMKPETPLVTESNYTGSPAGGAASGTAPATGSAPTSPQ